MGAMSVPSRIDLHTHSSVSDGTDSPAGLVRSAAAAGLTVVALTDHDTWDGLAEAARTAAGLGLGFVPGVEMSCEHLGHSVHLLGYGGDRSDPDWVAELARIRAGRADRIPAMLRRLAELGMPLTEAEVAAQAHDTPSIGRPHVADALVARGYVADRDEAFAGYLAEGGPAYVDRYAPDVFAAVRLVRAAGAVPVIAHPWGRDSRRVLPLDVLGELLAAGAVGWEVDHVEHRPEDRRDLRAYAVAHGALVTGSSDYHGTGKTHNPLGCETTAPDQYARLRELMGD
ncbi:PHP domain-containing protein [Raineyella sp.]|uniref:3',5'-nucleoside bisphosphate phosphatase n=1 Tax=bioreactor metagenome TaxID=1076179 RepID=A0A644XLS3_9ZZZZ|nr:PHP domain-containing protein [Raineyella sp.]MEA5154720.1 PHP domain-containing protein [Raineyella sp.]